MTFKKGLKMPNEAKPFSTKMLLLVITLIVTALFSVFGGALNYVANDYIQAVEDNTDAVNGFHEFIDSVVNVAPWELKDRLRTDSVLAARIIDHEKRLKKLEGD